MPKIAASKLVRTGFSILALLAAHSVHAQTDAVSAETLLAEANVPAKVHRSLFVDTFAGEKTRQRPDLVFQGTARDWLDTWPASLNAWQLGSQQGVASTSARRPIGEPQATLANGTLTALATTYNYSTAPWVITPAGAGTYPDGGGVATLNPVTSPTPGTILTGSTVTINVSPQLSGITYNSPFSYTLAVGTSTSIVADPTNGLTLNALFTPANTPTLFQLPNTITSPISGGGSAGLIKTGTGTVSLTGTNNFTGGTHFNGGILSASSTAAVGDAVFGATGAGNGLFFNGGGLFVNVTSGLTSARDIFLDAGGGTIYTNTSATLSGIISGAGNLTIRGFASGAGVTLTGNSSYTGATITNGSTVSLLTLSGNGSIATSSGYDLSGTLALSNAATVGINRLSDTAAITSRGVIFSLTGGATASSETVGAINLASGLTTVTVTPGAAGASLNAASINRQNNSLLSIRGLSLGATPGANVATVTAATAPTLVGGGGAAGSTTISIVPWAYGNLTANASLTAANNVNASLVTYAPTSGFRPLATAEYATAFGGNATDNVRITTDTTAPASTVNALLFAPTLAATLSGGTINVTSGTVLYSPTADVVSTISANLNFGTAEGIIVNTSALNATGVISGSGGLTLGSTSTGGIALGAANTYTGATNLMGGVIIYTGNVPKDGVTPSSFGLDTSAVVMNPGLTGVFMEESTASTFSRDLRVIGSGPASAYFGTTGDLVLTMNGNIDLQRNLTLYGGTTAASAMVLNGTISGPGLLTDAAGAYTTINGNNTFTGGVNISTGIYAAGSDTAFGTGTIFFSSTGTILAAGSNARTIANPMLFSATPTFTGTAPLTFTGGVNLNGSRTLAVSNTALTTFSGVVTGGAITKTLTGPLALNSTTGNTFTGGFVNSGAVASISAIYANNSNGSAFGTGAVSVGANSATSYSTLAGSFTTSGNTSIGGRLSPGNGTGLTPTTAGIGSIGTANFGGSLILSSATTSSLYLEIGGTPASGTFDKINVTGALTLAGTVNLATLGYTLTQGSTYDLVDWGSITAGTITFNTASATFGTDANGNSLYFDTSRFIIDGTVTVVPEPATVLGGVLTAGLLGLGVRRRWRASVSKV